MKEHFRVPLEYVEAWLAAHSITWEQIERGAPVWPIEENGVRSLIALDPESIERILAVEDPVIFAWLYLSCMVTIPGYCKRGDPLVLLPIQAQLARLTGNVIAECASEVGKTQDIGLQILHTSDTGRPGTLSLIGTNIESPAADIFKWIEYQLGTNPLLCGGLKRLRLKPHRLMEFNNETGFEARLKGDDGEQFRGFHGSGVLCADEAAKWKGEQQWSEFWRGGMPGSRFRIYTTPDGDYSSPYYAISARALALNGQNAEDFGAVAKAPEETPKFKKLWISKKHLGPPFYTEERLAEWREGGLYGPEHGVRWLNNIEGLWGTPSSSVFPAYVLKPLLKFLPDYRIVVAEIDREKCTVNFAAAELDAERKCERPLIHSCEPFDLTPGVNAKALAEMIAALFPAAVKDWVTPELFCGGDLGSIQDPSELLWVRVLGEKWVDLFRLHLESASYPEQANIVAHLDHASGHRTKYGFDPGNAGSSFVSILTETEEYQKCPVCKLAVYFNERVEAFGFGNSVDLIDLKTGKPILDPDRRDKAGNMLPHRLSNKEFATRILERKISGGPDQIAIAQDRGAGNPRLAGPEMMTNHTSSGETSKKGERRFRDRDDHPIDARRQAALKIIAPLRLLGTFVQPELSSVLRVGESRDVIAMGESMGSPRELFGESPSSRRPLSGSEW